MKLGSAKSLEEKELAFEPEDCSDVIPLEPESLIFRKRIYCSYFMGVIMLK